MCDRQRLMLAHGVLAIPTLWALLNTEIEYEWKAFFGAFIPVLIFAVVGALRHAVPKFQRNEIVACTYNLSFAVTKYAVFPMFTSQLLAETDLASVAATFGIMGVVLHFACPCSNVNDFIAAFNLCNFSIVCFYKDCDFGIALSAWMFMSHFMGRKIARKCRVPFKVAHSGLLCGFVILATYTLKTFSTACEYIEIGPYTLRI